MEKPMETPEETFSGEGVVEQPTVEMPRQEIEEKHAWRIVTLVVLLIAIAGGAFGYVSFFNSENLKPEEVLARSFEKSLEVESARSSVDFDIRFALADPFGGNDLFADSDTEDPEEKEEADLSEISIAGGFTGAYEDGKVLDISGNTVVSMDEDKLFSYDGDILTTDDKTYLFFRELRLHGFGAFLEFFLPFSLSDLEDKWIVYDESALSQVSPFGVPEDLFETEEDLTEEQSGALMGIFKKNRDVLVVREDHGIEKVNGDATYHYTVGIDPNKLIDMMEEVSVYLSEEELLVDTEYVDGTETTIGDAAREDIKTFLEENDIVFDLWIGKKDLLLRKIVTDWVLVIEESTNVRIKIEGIYSDYGKPVKVEVPEDAITFEELFEQISEAIDWEVEEEFEELDF